jgi:cytochrome c oxidase cbb3-type subunit 3
MADEREIDSETQTETTGHEWDGIKELDTPMPRWWLWTLYATIVWGIGYVILMPAWPLINSATPGLLGYSTRANVAAEIDAHRTRNAPLDARLNATPLAAVADDPELLRFAVAGGGAVFRNQCSQCHGAGGQGAIGGFPNLLDDDWLWGGTVDAIHQTVTHGVRDETDFDTRFSLMPEFGGILSAQEIEVLVQYVLSLSAPGHDAATAAGSAGAELFAANCASCHGDDGMGMQEQGAPSLADGIWLYGQSEDSVRTSITGGRGGVMPSFQARLDPAEIAKVAVYVHSLGGGQ